MDARRRTLYRSLAAVSFAVIATSAYVATLHSPSEERTLARYEAAIAAGDTALQFLRYSDAARHYERAIGISLTPISRRPTISWGHTMDAQVALSGVYRAEGRFTKALQTLDRARKIGESAYGEDNGVLLPIHRALSELHFEMGNETEATWYAVTNVFARERLEPQYLRAVEIQETRPNPHPLPVSEKLVYLGEFYLRCRRPDLAEYALIRAIDLQAQVLDPNDVRIDRTQALLTDAWDRLRKYHRALTALRGRLARLESEAGPESPRVLSLLERTADIEEDRGRYTESESLYARALSIRERVVGTDHPSLVPTLQGLARSLAGQPRYADALAAQRRVYEIHRSTHGPDHPVTGFSLFEVAYLEAYAGKTSEAIRSYDAALDILTRNRGADDAWTIECRDAYKELLLEQERVLPIPSANSEGREDGYLG